MKKILLLSLLALAVSSCVNSKDTEHGTPLVNAGLSKTEVATVDSEKAFNDLWKAKQDSLSYSGVIPVNYSEKW